MADSTYEALLAANKDLLFKALQGIILKAPMSSAAPTALTAGANAVIQTLPAGYISLGYVPKGSEPSFKPETELSEDEAWQAVEPIRSDIIKRDMSVTLGLFEHKQAVLELWHGIDLTGNTEDATTKEIQFNDPTAPDTIYNRFLFLMRDGTGAREKWIGRFMPRANVTAINEQQWGREKSLMYGMTIKAKVDDDLGYSVRNFIAGKGIQSLIGDMGW